jgi:hypothetical protein
MKLNHLHNTDERNEAVYDESLRTVMKSAAGKRALMYIIRDMYYFVDTKSKDARAVRTAALRLLDRVEKSTGYALDFNFSR